MLPRRKKSIKGSAIVESTLAMFVIFLVLGGLLQLFYFAVAQMLTDYAALRGVRSHIVGFRPYLVTRIVQVNAIGASGNIAKPSLPKGDWDRDYTEKSYVNTYLTGWRWLEYEKWHGNNKHNMGEFVSSNSGTTLSHFITAKGNLAHIRTKFSDYGLLFLRSKEGKTRIQSSYVLENEKTSASKTNLFFGDLDIEGTAAMFDHAPNFLQLGEDE